MAFPDEFGGHFVLVKAAVRRRLALAQGDRVEVAIERAPPSPRARMPDELKALLADSREARLAWDGLTDAARQMASRWVGSAKSEDLRAYRASDVVRRALRHHAGAGPFYPTQADQRLLSRPPRQRHA
jgi:hypothetical protein